MENGIFIVITFSSSHMLKLEHIYSINPATHSSHHIITSNTHSAQPAPTRVTTSVLLSISPTSRFVCRSCWIWGLDIMSCLVS